MRILVAILGALVGGIVGVAAGIAVTAVLVLTTTDTPQNPGDSSAQVMTIVGTVAIGLFMGVRYGMKGALKIYGSARSDA